MRCSLILFALLPLACSSAAIEEDSITIGDTTSAKTSTGPGPGSASDATGVSSSPTSTDASATDGPETTASSETTGPWGPDATTGGGDTGSSTGTPPPEAGSRVPVGGEDKFLLGANYPWKSYGGDFGANAWGTYGVHTKPDDFGAQFQQMADSGLQVVRWFVFTDGRAGVIFDNTGTPSGLGEFVLEDFEAAIQIAKARGVYLVPVLLDFHWMFWSKQDGQVQSGGRSDTITDPVKRAALVEKVFIPLLDAYAKEPTILAWEIMNEPEWSISDLPEGQPDGNANAVPLKDFYALSKMTADAVHMHTKSYVTLGSASLKWIKVWTPAFAATHDLPALDLDFYQAHYYSWMDGQGFDNHPVYGTLKWSPMDQDYAPLELDRPLVIGELVISDNAGAKIDTLVDNGYAGVWPWSLNSDYSVDLAGIKAWSDAHVDIADLPAP